MKFRNIDAEMYGFDLSWEWRLASAWRLSGIASYIRGKRTDIDDNLYRIAPPNASIALRYGRNNAFLTMEGMFYGRGEHLSEEIILKKARSSSADTPRYALLNFSGVWHPREQISLVLGVENLFNKRYTDHLSGFNRVRNSDVPIGTRITGPGRNLFVRVGFDW